MNIIKLDATDSTNVYLRRLSAAKELEDYTVVMSKTQSSGKGQMGTSWQSESGKNLTCSVFKKVTCVGNDEQFYLSVATSLAIFKALKHFSIPQLKIKWPNDILSANRKICGILIENVIKNGKMSAAILGIGLNVNQAEFGNLHSASSLKLITGVHYDLDEILHQIILQLRNYESLIMDRAFTTLKEEYETHLFRVHKPSTFKTTKGELLMGFIKGVSDHGKLQVMLEDEVLKEFDLKELKLLY